MIIFVKVQLLKTLEKKPVNEIYWSPAGHNLVLAGMKTHTQRHAISLSLPPSLSLSLSLSHTHTLSLSLARSYTHTHTHTSGMKTLNGQLLFFNADDNEILGEDEHFLCTDIVWDPTGRCVTYLCISIGYINGTVVYSSCKHCSLLL